MGSSPVPLLRTALTLFVPTSCLSWLVKQRFPLGPVPAALSQLVPVGVVLEGAIWDDPAIEANYVSAEERRGSIRRKKRNSAQVVWMLERWEAVVLRLWRLPPGGDSIVAFSKRPSGRGCCVHPNPVLKCGGWKDSVYKVFWSGNSEGTNGVGILLAKKWTDKVFEVQRPSDRIILLKLIIGKTVYTLVNVYAPQQGRPKAEKDRFYDQLNRS